MKEDHAVALVLGLLIFSLILVSFSQSDITLTGHAVADGGTSTPEKFAAGFASVLVAMVAIFAFQSLYLKDRRINRGTNYSVDEIEKFLPDSLGVEFKSNKKSDVDQIREFVKDQRSTGVDDNTIRMKLNAVGWNPELVERVLR